MSQSEVVNCCMRRQRRASGYIYVLIVVWILLVTIALVLQEPARRKSLQSHIEADSPVHLNIFEKWHLSNYRSSFEEHDAAFSQPFSRNDSDKQTYKIEDILKYFGKEDDATRRKVFAILDSLSYSESSEIPEQLNCKKIMEGDKEAILKGKLSNLELSSKAKQPFKSKLISSLDRVTKAARNCDHFRNQRAYITIPLSKEEASYPIAYIITIHKDLPSFERLLRSIYHPQNIHCIHVDLKSDTKFKEGVAAIAECFDNVFIASNLTSVRYTHYSRVQADLNCMRDLVKWTDKYPWKYVINLCGQDFPLKTNLEMVRALKNLQGFNNLETFKTPEHKKRRYEFHFDLPDDPKHDHAVMKRTTTKKLPPPNGIEMFAGSAYYIYKRQAVEYMMTDHVLQNFFAWNEDTYSPDEHMWSTIQRMFPQLPGSFPPHEKYDLNELQTITRIVKWGGLDTKVYPKCEGRFVRGICVYGCGDLAWLIVQRHLFANKFDPEIDYFAIHCLERFIRGRTIDQAKRYFLNGYL